MLKIEQWYNRGVLGVTHSGVADWTFTAEAGQSTASPYGAIHHIVFVVDSVGGETRAYVDGVHVGTLAQVLDLASASAVLGDTNLRGDASTGIHAFAAYNRALTVSEILSHRSIAINFAPVVTSATFGIDENVLAETVVGSVSFSDENERDSHSYVITAGNTNNAFQIDSLGGITTLGSIDRESIASYSLTVTVTDNGSPSLSGSGIVTVNINDVVSEDNDADGMDDAWEVTNFTTTTIANGTTDADADGQKDVDEFRAGTDPNDATDLFKITQLISTANEVTVRWTAKDAKSYRIRYSYDLDIWSDVVAGQTSGADGEMTYLDTNGSRAAATKVFYRVEVE